MNAGRATVRMAVAAVLVVALIAGLVTATRPAPIANRTNVTAYFDNSNGLFVGDDVRILGVPVGSVTTIEPQPSRVKVTFWLDGRYKVPAEAKAVILSPSLVTARAIQPTPAYTSGLALSDGAVIPRERTAVPVEWDDVRVQLQRLTETLQPAPSDGVSPLGALINTAADNLRGQGANIRATVIGLSQAISALGDHSTNLFGTVRNLSILVTALQDSSELMRQLNQNLASITGLFANDPDEIENAVRNLDDVLGGVRDFVSQNRESVGTTSDKLASVSRALTDSLDDIEQLLHVTPTALQNFVSIYQPAQGTLSGALSINNLSDPISFICGGVQAAARLGAEQSAKLCVQYLAPIVKNRQYSFPPIGVNPIVGASARPNEVTYSEDWMRPDHGLSEQSPADAQPPAEVRSTDPAAGLAGMLVPPGGGR